MAQDKSRTPEQQRKIKRLKKKKGIPASRFRLDLEDIARSLGGAAGVFRPMAERRRRRREAGG